MGTMKGFSDYVKNREERLAKLEDKIGFSMNENLQNAYKSNYTPTGTKNDITHFLTRRDSKEAEAERVANLAKKGEEAKSRIDKIFSEKASTNKSASLNPLDSEFINTNKNNVDRKYMSIADRNKYDTEVANEYINQRGYLDKNADKETRNKYYSDYLKAIGYTDDEIEKSLGVGGQVSLNEGFLGKINSSIRNAIAPGYDEGAQILANLNAKNQGSKVGNVASNLVGNTLGLALNPGGEFVQGKNLLNVADDFAEGVASKVAPKLGNSSIGKVATRAVRGAVDGGIGGGIDSFKTDNTQNIASNVANGALGGALMFGGQKALGEVGNAFRGLKTPFSKVNAESGPSTTNKVKKEVANVPTKATSNSDIKFEKTNVNVGRDLTNIKEVGDRSVKLLSNEMGELKPYIKEEAQTTLRELNDVVKGERFAKYNDVTGETVVTGTQKQVSPTIQAIQDLIPNASYDKIRKGLNDIIEGKDTAIAKKIELILDDNLSNGRFSGNEGYEVAGNQEYKYIKDMYNAMNEGKLDDFLKKQATKDVNQDRKIYIETMESETPKRFDNTVKVNDINKEVAVTEMGNGKYGVREIKNGSKFANDTVFNSDLASPELRKGIMEREMSYDPVTNKGILSDAQKLIDSDFNGSYARVMSEKPVVDAEYMAMGQDLVRRLQNEGRYDEAINVLEKVTKEGSKSGQAIQALSMWRNLTPEGMLAHAQKQINRANAELPKGKSKIKLTGDEVKAIAGKMEEVQSLPDGREKDILLAEVNKIIANKIPSNLMDKIDSFRYINMLFNPKTLIKNAAGNVINTTMGNMRDIIATPIDKVVGKFTGERTVGLPNLKEQTKGLVDGIKTVTDDYKRGIDTSGDVKEGSRAGAFNNVPVMGEIERLLSAGLKMGDVPFYEAAKNNYLSNVMKLNGVDTPTAKMIEDANQAGLEATFQQQTGLGNAISNLKNSKSKPVSVATKTILPFSQTPSAILDTSVNYTPLGIARGAYNLSKGNQRQGVNQLASGILGTGAMGVGVGLTNNGYMTGSLSDDSETAALQRQAGMQAYALKNGDNYYSIDFAQPAASPLMAGADMANGANIGDMAETVVNSILDNSYLSGLKDIGETIGEKGFGGALGEVARNYASQLLPFNALSGQITRTLDPAIRDTYDTDATQRFINQSMSKYPGLSQMLPQGIDTVGEDKYYNEGAGLAERALRNFVLPFNTTTYQPNEVEEKALDIYNDTGETIQMPRYAKDTISYGGGKSYALTAEEKRDYSKALASALKKAPKDAEEMQKAMNKATKEFNEKIKKKHNLK